MAAESDDSSRAVHDASGSVASLVSFPEGASEATLLLASGRRVQVPADTLRVVGDAYHCTLDFERLGVPEERLVIPLVEEQVAVERCVSETGRVRIAKRVETREAVVDEALLREEVEVERVSVGRYVEGPVAVRHEGDTTIIPILEEVLVVEKRLLLKEELHVTKRKTDVRDTQRVELREEHVEVERLSPTDGAESGVER